MGPGDIIDAIQEKLFADSGTDYIYLHEGIGLTEEVLNKILGILVVFVIVGMPVVVAIELLFINIPALNYPILEAIDNKTPLGKIFGLCLRDAKRAIVEADTVRTGESVNMVYFKIKIKSIIIAVFIVGMILGPGKMLVVFLGNRLQDILDLIS